MKAHLVTALVAGTLLTASFAGAQDADISAARDLYASAAYDDALNVLNRLRSVEHPASQSRAIEQYRAFCLLALGRPADAEQAIEAVVAAEPSYQPAETDASPRIRSAFTAVRRRMLPSIIQQKYAQAKAAFDRKELHGAAADGFSYVLTALADQDVAAEAKQPPLSDLRTLAGGFQELAAKAAAPPPPPPAPVVAPAPPPPPPPPAPPRIYSGGESGVVAPGIVNQALPPFPGQVIIPRSGKLEVVIDETGTVETAVITGSVTQTYDQMVLAAARTWRYRPATLNGAPVKFRKTVQVTIKPTP